MYAPVHLDGWTSAPLKNMQTQNSTAQPLNAFLATVNQMFGSSSQLTTTTEHCFVFWTVLDDLITTHSAAVRSWEEPPNIDWQWQNVKMAKFVGWALKFRVHMLLQELCSKLTVHLHLALLTKLLTFQMTVSFSLVKPRSRRLGGFLLCLRYIYIYFLSVTISKPPRMMSSSANYRPSLGSFRRIPPQEHFCKVR